MNVICFVCFEIISCLLHCGYNMWEVPRNKKNPPISSESLSIEDHSSNFIVIDVGENLLSVFTNLKADRCGKSTLGCNSHPLSALLISTGIHNVIFE